MERRRFLAGVAGTAGSALLHAAWNPAAAAFEGPAEDGRRAGLPHADADPWRDLPRQFQLPAGFAYFNTAGLGASPRAVTDRVKAMMDREEESPSPGHSEADWARIRGKAARLLGPSCAAEEIALVSTATEGINVILNGLGLGRGDEVVTTTHEHVGLAIPLLQKMKTAGIELKTFEPDLQSARGNVDRIAALLTSRTRLVFLSHVTCTTGQLLPVAEIGRLASEHGAWFALDGAQSLAQFPIDIRAIGADFYAASCHKWLMGPKRTGLLYVRRDRLEQLAPSIVGAYSDASNSLASRRLTLQPTAQRFEFGTQNDAQIYGLEAALDFVSGLGLPAIEAHDRALADSFLKGLREIPGVQVLTPADAAARVAMVTFRLLGRDNRAVSDALVRRRHRVRSVTEAGLDAVRASFHVCNTPEQVEELIVAVDDIAAGE